MKAIDSGTLHDRKKVLNLVDTSVKVQNQIIGDNLIYENRRTNFRGTLINIALRCDESYYCLATEAHQLKKRLF